MRQTEAGEFVDTCTCHPGRPTQLGQMVPWRTRGGIGLVPKQGRFEEV